MNQNASKTIAIDRSGTTTSTDYFRFEGRILPPSAVARPARVEIIQQHDV